MTRRFLAPATGPVEDLDKHLGRPVEDRHFRPVQLDDSVVDGQGRHGGHQVLDGRDRDAGGIVDHGAKTGLADRFGGHADGVVDVLDVGAHKGDAGIGSRRTHHDPDMDAGVNANAREDHGPGDSVLMVLRHRHLKPF